MSDKPEVNVEGVFHHVFRVVRLLSPRERRNLALLSLGTVFLALVEVLGVGSIMPFISVASRPEIIHTNEYLFWVYKAFHFSSENSFLIFLGAGLLVFLILTNGTSALLHYYRVRFTSLRRHSLSYRLFKAYLGQPYHFFLNRDSFDFVKNISGEIQNMITGTLTQLVDIIAKAIQILFLSTFLFIVDPWSTLLILGSVGGSYSVIYFIFRKMIHHLGKERFDAARGISRIVSEAFWGIKEVKLLGIESTYISEFIVPSKKLAKNLSKSEVIGDLPKFALETVAFSAIVLIVLMTLSREGNFSNAAATVTLFGYAGYRIIPAVQALFKAFTKLRHSAPTAERLIAEFALERNAEQIKTVDERRLPFERLIELKAVSFSYPNVIRKTIDNVSLSIPINSLTGLAGKTGSGKTTIADLILGLLRIQNGELFVDGIPITDNNMKSWQQNIGYVPQSIYLFNDSVASNIAFGIPKNEINMEAVHNAARMAQIEDFISSELKDGYQTLIGERGVRLSGGQRQRIGIARALYRNPAVLVMDEATSALDSHTEKAVMEAIDDLHGLKTILLIAHRLTTLSKCDKIYLFEKGRIIESGSYADLAERNDFFSRYNER